ncbi:hypothetical protein KC367_g52 [Hortaea werneckii]|nr:hypothetical protein KC367_g52 [Hortaea werneckii]
MHQGPGLGFERFAAHLAGKHKQYLDLAGTPYQCCVRDDEGLRDKSEVGAEMRERVGWILAESAVDAAVYLGRTRVLYEQHVGAGKGSFM